VNTYDNLTVSVEGLQLALNDFEIEEMESRLEMLTCYGVQVCDWQMCTNITKCE
jgi:hypothetical protein